MLDKRARAHLERELTQLSRLLEDYAELLATPEAEAPDLFARTALSSVVQSFYQGIESVLQTVAKRVDGHMPAGSDWHRKLLEQMVVGRDQRPALISPATLGRLEPFLGFRHLARHTYPFLLEWGRMCHLVREMVPAYEQFRAEVEAFLAETDEATAGAD